jgi:hypothetical protein
VFGVPFGPENTVTAAEWTAYVVGRDTEPLCIG